MDITLLANQVVFMDQDMIIEFYQQKNLYNYPIHSAAKTSNELAFLYRIFLAFETYLFFISAFNIY